MGIVASKDQIDKIYKKHLFLPVVGIKYTIDEENDNKGFVSCFSLMCNHMQWQMHEDEPCFFSLYTSDLRYDINYPKGKVFDKLQKIGVKARTDFWKGNQI